MIRQECKVDPSSIIFYISVPTPAEFPRTPSGALKRNITDEADARLAFYLSPDEPPPPGVEAPPRPRLPDGMVDAPLVRLFNFLRK